METTSLNSKKHKDHIIRSLTKIDASIRNGQFVYAHRESNKLLSELKKNQYEMNGDVLAMLQSSLKRTILFIHPIIEAYAQNQKSLDIVRKNINE
jgi:3-methyladenine DNA glycosylase Tag